jgi:large repetitive protein
MFNSETPAKLVRSVPLLMAFIALMALLFPPSLPAQEIQEVSRFVRIDTTHERTRLDRVSREITSTVDVTLTNVSNAVLSAPLRATLDLDLEGISMPGASGGPNEGPGSSYYYDLTHLLPGGILAPGEKISFQAVFVRNAQQRFGYTFKIWSQMQ